MKQLNLLILAFLLLASCQQGTDFQSISKASLSKELIETKADSGLVILLKDSKAVAKASLILEDTLYKEGDARIFQTKRDMGTLLSPIYLMEALGRIALDDTVDVGNGIYINKEGKEIRDHNADKGGYGVISVKQAIAFDSRIGITKIMESCGIKPLSYSPLEVVEFYNKIAKGDTTLCSNEVMKDIQGTLRMVVTGGTGKNLDLENLEVSGKTGKADEDEISCCAYFEMDGSIYTCLVIISNPREGYPSGGTMCGEVIKGIIKEITNTMPNG